VKGGLFELSLGILLSRGGMMKPADPVPALWRSAFPQAGRTGDSEE
jgi:hypothetical protein